MKNILLSFFILTLFISALLPQLVLAEGSDMLLYNRDEIVVPEHAIEQYNGEYYICVNDLSKCDLDTYANGALISIERIRTRLAIDINTNDVFINGRLLSYDNPVINVNTEHYILLPLIADVFSRIYDVDEENKEINLWINDRYTATIRGIVSLPNGKVAPEGGFEVTVYKGSTPNYNTGYGGGYNPQVGFAGRQKPEIPKPTDIFKTNRVSISEQKQIIITEGENSAEYYFDFSVSNGHDSSSASYNSTPCVGYIVNSTKFVGGNRYNCGKYDMRIDMYLDYFEKRIISGTVTLPNNATEDTSFTVVVDGGKEDYFAIIFIGTIGKGEASCSYSVLVKPNKTYSVRIIFDDGRYLRQRYYSEVEVVNTDVENVDFNAVPSKRISGYLVLPYGFTSIKDINAMVTLQSTDTPHYYLSEQEVTVDAQTNSGYFELYDDIGVENVIVYYSLSDEQSGLYNYGHYSVNGTKSSVKYADILEINNQEICLPLLKGNTISGYFENNSQAGDLEILAIAQTTPMEYAANVNTSDLVAYGYSNGAEYSINIPLEYEKYILAIYSPLHNSYLYYSHGDMVKELNNAEIIQVTANVEGLNLTYMGYDPILPIIIESVYMDANDNSLFHVSLYNDSDFAQDNLVVSVCFYDKSIRLKNIVKGYADCLYNSYSDLDLSLNNYYTEADVVKVFVWNENLMPLSEPYILKDTVLREICEIKDTIVFQADNATMYINNIPNELEYAPVLIDGQLLVPLRTGCEAIGISVYWDEENLQATFEYDNSRLIMTIDSYEAVSDNCTLQLDVPMQIINDISFIPLEVLSRFFGIPVQWDSLTKTLTINQLYTDIPLDDKFYDAITTLVKYGIIRGYEDGTYHPDNDVFRSEFCAVVCKTLGTFNTKIEFYCSDVSLDHWASSFIGFCVNTGIFTLENDEFRPDESITTGEAINALLNMLGFGEDVEYSQLLDVANQNGLLINLDNLDVDASLSRAVCAQLIFNTIAKIL